MTMLLHKIVDERHQQKRQMHVSEYRADQDVRVAQIRLKRDTVIHETNFLDLIHLQKKADELRLQVHSTMDENILLVSRIPKSRGVLLHDARLECKE